MIGAKVGAGVFSVDICNNSIGGVVNENSSWQDVEKKLVHLWNAIPLFGLHNEEELPLYPQYENIIAQNPVYSVVYASCFVKGAFPAGEKSISRNSFASYFYSVVCLKKRFELGESAIADNTKTCLEYCIKIFKRKKLPPDMHRKMLAHGIKDSGDKYVKRYFSFKGVSEC